MVLSVAHKLTKEQDLYSVGFELELEHAEIEANIKNNRDAITMAAYHMLRTWVVQQQDRQHAFTLLVTALEGAKLKSIVDEVLRGN